jgi:acetyl-CoA synthetase
VLKAKGIGKGDTATITMPMIAEAAYAMLAYARVGAVHLVVFGGLSPDSPDSLAGRIKDCESKVLVTVEESVRGGRTIPLEANADEAVGNCAGAK